MPGADLLLSFFLASLVFACVPGPGMLYMAAETLAAGRRAGWYSALGFHLASYLHILAAAFSLSLLVQTLPVLFQAIKLAGAGYLIWLGLRYLFMSGPLAAAAGGYIAKSPGRALRDSMTVELLNPKSLLFYFTFLPQFTDASAVLPLWAQMLVLGTLVNGLFTAVDAVLIELSDAATRRLRASIVLNKVLRRIGGGILLAIGVNLACARQ